jgi:hypothetical protein
MSRRSNEHRERVKPWRQGYEQPGGRLHDIGEQISRQEAPHPGRVVGNRLPTHPGHIVPPPPPPYPGYIVED